MGATSIHVQAVKPGSEIHNFREKELDYVRPELSHLNESWVGDSISHRLESAKQRYFDTVGQKMQTKAAPIREGVIVIKQETTMQELQQFAAVCKERFGIEAFQIHIHKDEGYMNAKQWTPNLHAHVVFDWTQPNGKSVRLSRDDMAELQTIASEALGMERGVSSDRKHLSAMQYKTECAKEQLQELSNDISSALDKHKDVQNQLLQLQKELRSIETKKNVQKLISKASEKFYGLIGKTVNDREKDALKAKIKALEGENEQLSDRLGKAILEKERNGTKVFKAENDKEYYRQQMDNARTTSNRLRTENQELKTETKELKKELGKSCQHCDHAPCVDVCPTGASFRDAASGIVDVNPDLCVGCQYCIAACPYRVRFIHPVTKTADKCDFCRKTNLQAGKLPACVEACPTKALTFGNLDDPNSEISQLLRQKPTYRYKLALGTKPKLYRVPFKYGEVSQ